MVYSAVWVFVFVFIHDRKGGGRADCVEGECLSLYMCLYGSSGSLHEGAEKGHIMVVNKRCFPGKYIFFSDFTSFVAI